MTVTSATKPETFPVADLPAQELVYRDRMPVSGMACQAIIAPSVSKYTLFQHRMCAV